jgi:hypothetical protein
MQFADADPRCWGENAGGDGSVLRRDSPVAVPGL